MTAHAARAVRGQYGDPRGLWRAVCDQNCRIRRATSKQDAEWAAREHELLAGIADAAKLTQHDCYDVESMEYGVCARCILDGLLESRRAA